jgi:hypothetical protein
MEGFGRGEARRSDGDARMVQLVRCAVASTTDGVILAMCSDGGVWTPARLHGWRTAYDIQALARQRVHVSRAAAWAWSTGCYAGEHWRGRRLGEGERARRVRERSWVGREEGKSRPFTERERERRGRRGKRKRWPAMASRPLMGGSNGEGRNGCVKAP